MGRKVLVVSISHTKITKQYFPRQNALTIAKQAYLFVFYIIETPSVYVSGVFVKSETLVGFVLKCLELSKHTSELYNAV